MTTKKISISLLRGKLCISFIIFLLPLLSLQHANAESYTLSVGESVRIWQNTYAGGYICKVVPIDYLDAHLSFHSNEACDAVITVNSYFDYPTTVKLYFVERYQSYYNGRWHPQIFTSQKVVTIRCKYQKPDPSKKPTRVALPERIKVPIHERVTVEPILEPYGAVAMSSSWDFNIEWTTCHSYPVENSINCQLVGMRLGVGKATITIDGDENLKASTIIEVFDPNNPSPNNIVIPDTVEVSVGKVCTVSPIMVPEGTSTSMNWYSENTSIATVEAGRITGQKEGETYVYYKTLYELRDTCVVRVVRQDGMDDDTDIPSLMGVIDGHEYVDLGLNTLWATYNVGASSIFEEGEKFAWSETLPKSSYTESNYTGNKGSGNINIQGTSQDAAYIQWSNAWRIPTSSQFTEIFGKCTFEGEAVNTKSFIKANANNGASLYFPTNSTFFWTANSYTGMINSSLANAAYITTTGKNTDNQPINRYKGHAVRAVSSVDPLAYGEKPTAISLSSPITIKVTDSFVPNYTIIPDNATTPLKWYSEDPLVASVSPMGVVKAVSVGTTKLWIETGNGLKASCDVTVEGMPKVVQVFGGPSCNFLLDETGTLWGTGYNDNGILADGKVNNKYLSPKIVMHDVVDASIGGVTSVAALITKKDGTLWSAGSSTRGLLDDSNSPRYYYKKVMDDVVSAEKCSNLDSYILKKDGSLWYGTSTKLADNVKSLSGNLYHTLVVKNDGTLWACGENENGQLGDGTTTDKTKLVKIADSVLSAATGWRHSLFIKKDGTLWGCGSNSSGQLGDGVGESTIIPVKIMDDVHSVSAGYYYTLVIKNDGTLWGFGTGVGQMDNTTTDNAGTPIKIAYNVVSATAAGWGQSFFIRNDGSLWGWGKNTSGQLGDGSGEDKTKPVKIIKGDVHEIHISTSEDGYATFFSSEDAYKLPEGLNAMVVNSVSNDKLTYYTIAEGTMSGVIPIATAVMLVSDTKRTRNFTLTSSDTMLDYSGTNFLHGSDETTTTTGDGYHYKLSYGPSNTGWNRVFGWYWGGQNGAPFQIEGHKAWLVVPKSNGARSYTIDGDATGISQVDADDMEDCIYDLQGRRINAPVKNGVYIQNGRKVVVK